MKVYEVRTVVEFLSSVTSAKTNNGEIVLRYRVLSTHYDRNRVSMIVVLVKDG